MYLCHQSHQTYQLSIKLKSNCEHEDTYDCRNNCKKKRGLPFIMIESTKRTEWTPSPEFFLCFLILSSAWGGSSQRLLFKTGTNSQEKELGCDHEDGLKDKRSFEPLEEVEVEPEDVSDQQYQTYVDWKGSYWLFFDDETVLEHVSSYRTNCHAWIVLFLHTSKMSSRNSLNILNIIQ